MRVSINWLKELVDITLTPEELGQTLTMAGFEVEEIIDLRSQAKGVVVGKVLECDRHPNADKLSVCKVDIGQDKPLSIVCGAANIRKDVYVPVATIGTYLPAVDLKIKRSKLRGEVSEGMICSLAELGLAQESEGIYIFESDKLKPGDDVRPLLGLDDVILDLSTTANRADALSMVGIAREVAALTGASLHLPYQSASEIPQQEVLGLDIADTKACLAYIGTIIAGVKISPSPNWLQWRLQAAGVRPINNVVDVTNYILLEWGQPLHAFDREKLAQVAGSENLTIGVRFAQPGEKLTTLDGRERVLFEQNLIITGNNKPVALAGVMGGESTEVDEQTRHIVLEAALFDPIVIRRSARSQSLRTESSTRYERGVNLAELDQAVNRAIALIQELAQGKPVGQAKQDSRPDLAHRPPILLRLSRLQQILGKVRKQNTLTDITAPEVEKILTDLGCKLEKLAANNSWQVTIPPYRQRDLEREIDLIEEVARLYGYDRFANTLPNKTLPGYLSQEYRVKNLLREAFRGVGLTEVVHYSLVKPGADKIKLDNPLFAEYSALRSELLTGLIEAYAYNKSQGTGSLNAIEIGRVFGQEGDIMQESDRIAGILGGDFQPRGNWVRGGKPEPMSWYQAKGILESVFNRLNLEITYQADSTNSRLHPGRTASLWLKQERLGTFGQLHPQLCQSKDLEDEVYVFDLDFELLRQALEAKELTIPHFQPYSTYPPTTRDLALFAPLEITVADLIRVIKQAGGKLLTEVQLFDEYKGENVPEGQRSLAFNLIYQARDRTLTEEEVEPVHQKIRDTLVKEFSVTLRS